MNKSSIILNRKTFLLMALLLAGGLATAQVTIDGNVYGGGNLGQVDGSTTVTVNDGTIGKKIPLKDRKVDKDVQFNRVDYGNVYGGGNGIPETGTTPDRNKGLVTGNTTVTIGNSNNTTGPVVRRAVYGGGNMASVGEYTVTNGVVTYTAGGQTNVTVCGHALIGPKKEDLTSTTEDEYHDFFGANATVELAKYIDTAFKYLGGNEGWVYGGSRGIAGDDYEFYSFTDTTSVVVCGDAQAMNVFGSGENGQVKKATDVVIKDNAIIGGVPLHGTEYSIPTNNIYFVEGLNTLHLNDNESEIYEDSYGVGPEITRGNVLGGGKGTDFVVGVTPHQFCYYAGNVYGNTHVTVQDNVKIYNRVYGGGLLASVGTFLYGDANNTHAVTGIAKKPNSTKDTGQCYVTINGGIIGSGDGHNSGEVFGGSRGRAGRPQKTGETLSLLHQVVDLAYVGHTHVTVDGGTVKSSVYGGAANGHVQGDTYVTIKQTNSQKPTTIGSAGHGAWHSNVYGGGGGTAKYTDTKTVGGETVTFTKHSISAGRVYGDTHIDIQGGSILHNVYGGGSLASVGDYLKVVDGNLVPFVSGGHAYIDITGGTIGTNGDNNGMVFGSGRGEIAAPDTFMDTLTYMAYTHVNIGKQTGGTNNDLKINGSVYGSGESGHVYLQSTINIYSGTIGCSALEYSNMSDYDKEHNFPYRGNVYGAGCGTDMYDPDQPDPTAANYNPDTYNPNAGYVWGNTQVNIYGGYISRNVYGGGAMGAVGYLNHSKTVKHKMEDIQYQVVLSWPYYLEFASIPNENNAQMVETGTVEVNIYGGHIGTVAAPVDKSGDIYGAPRGDVGPLYHLDTLAFARKSFVTVNFTPPTNNVINDATANVILGSVYGSGENGFVYEDSKVTVNNGLIRGSVFGGGKGTDMYNDTLWVMNGNGHTVEHFDVHSITAGKVYGNTEVTINNGYILHNVFGGGNLASVGKGNYIGYGEQTSTSLPAPTPTSVTSGITTVKVYGGFIGTEGTTILGNNITGFVFGSSKGTTFPDVNNPSNTPRYNFSRDFFLGYSNKTKVIIGNPDQTVTSGPRIYSSVFGGGNNGHVRFETDVTVNKGEIGMAYADGNFTDAQRVLLGNVYGAGRGLDPIAGTNPPAYCNSAGSVTLNTNVTVKGGTIHRNVYGGGSLATVGPPPTGYNPGTSTCTVNIKGGTIGEHVTPTDPNDDPFNYGGDIFGGGRGVLDPNIALARFASVSNTEVNIDSLKINGNIVSSADVLGNVYGGGEIGQTKTNTLVNMAYGNVAGSVYGGGKGEETDEKAALVAGNTTVNMTNGTVERSIYGGGQLANVGTYIDPANPTSTDPNLPYYTAEELQLPANAGHVLGEPKACKSGTGLASVSISGGQVGLNNSLMPGTNSNPDDDDRGWVFCGGRGSSADTIADHTGYNAKANLLGIVGWTYLEISKTETTSPVISASVYGGCENGLVLDSTYVKIMGGQIGTGHYTTTSGGTTTHHWDAAYSEQLWTNAIAAVNGGNPTTINNIAAQFHECDYFPYGIDHDNNPETPKVYNV